MWKMLHVQRKNERWLCLSRRVNECCWFCWKTDEISVFHLRFLASSRITQTPPPACDARYDVEKHNDADEKKKEGNVDNLFEVPDISAKINFFPTPPHCLVLSLTRTATFRGSYLHLLPVEITFSLNCALYFVFRWQAKSWNSHFSSFSLCKLWAPPPDNRVVSLYRYQMTVNNDSWQRISVARIQQVQWREE